MKNPSSLPASDVARSPAFNASDLQNQVRGLVAVLHQINGSPAKLSPQDEASLQAAIDLANDISTHVEVLAADGNPDLRRTDRSEADYRARRGIDANRTFTAQERAEFESGLVAPHGHTEAQFRSVNSIDATRPLTADERARFEAWQKA